MTRKHFTAIAEALLSSAVDTDFDQESPAWWAEHQRSACCRAVATALKSLNPNFNRSRFLEACGVDEEE